MMLIYKKYGDEYFKTIKFSNTGFANFLEIIPKLEKIVNAKYMDLFIHSFMVCASDFFFLGKVNMD